MIHQTAIIHPKAQIDPTVDVGPYSVIDEHVVMGPGCVVGPHAYLTGHTSIGANNHFHAGCVIGDAPQDLKYKGEPTRLRIGDNNTFREQVTVHRSNKLAEDTIVGSNNLFMANAHVGHNVIMGNHNILANGVLLAGHVTIEDRAILSGHCLVHQFCRVGTLAMMQGGSAISKDLAPFVVACGKNGVCGLNVVGLRRAGFTSEQRLELKALYHELFRSRRQLSQLLSSARDKFTSEPARAVLDFVSASKRGFCRDNGRTSRSGEGLGDGGID